MDTSLKLAHNGLLFRPWDCQNRLKSTDIPLVQDSRLKKIDSKLTEPVNISSTNKCFRLQNAAPPNSVTSIRPHLLNNITPRNNLYSLLNPSHCVYQMSNKLPHSKPADYNFRPAHYALPFALPDLSHGLVSPVTVPGNMYNIPALYGYNFQSNLSNSLLGDTSSFGMNSFMGNKNLVSTSSASQSVANTACLNMSDFAKTIEQQNLLDRPNKKPRPKRFQCPHCQVSFSNNGQLKGHIRIHTG